MPAKVWMLRTLHDALIKRGIDPETLRSKFADYKAGDEHEHIWFCYDKGPDAGDDLHHVHMIPNGEKSRAEWMEKWRARGRQKGRRRDRYLLNAYAPHHGHLIIDVLDDPGAHDLWKQRRTTLAGYEEVAWDFAANGTKNRDCC